MRSEVVVELRIVGVERNRLAFDPGPALSRASSPWGPPRRSAERLSISGGRGGTAATLGCGGLAGAASRGVAASGARCRLVRHRLGRLRRRRSRGGLQSVRRRRFGRGRPGGLARRSRLVRSSLLRGARLALDRLRRARAILGCGGALATSGAGAWAEPSAPVTAPAAIRAVPAPRPAAARRREARRASTMGESDGVRMKKTTASKRRWRPTDTPMATARGPEFTRRGPCTRISRDYSPAPPATGPGPWPWRSSARAASGRRNARA